MTRCGLIASLMLVGAARAVAAPPSTNQMPVGSTVNVIDLGADPTGGADSTRAIQAAIDAAAPSGATVRVPAGTYRIVPATPASNEQGPLKAAFIMRSHMHIQGEPGAVLRVADDVSTDSAPIEAAMFFNAAVLVDVSIRGLTMDMNGARNRISPRRKEGVYEVRKNWAQIASSGTPNGVAARIDDAVIEDNTFLNTPGVCSLVLAQSNKVGVVLGKRWRITHNTFRNNGIDSADYTAIYAYADGVLAEGNTFWQDEPFVGPTGSHTGYEVHGSNQRVIGNHFHNLLRGMYIADSYGGAVDNTVITGNVFTTTHYGINFDRHRQEAGPIRNTLIDGNAFAFSSHTYPGSPNRKIAIDLSTSRYGISGVSIQNNVFLSTDDALGSHFLYLITPATPDQPFSNIVVRNNQLTGASVGIWLATSAASPLGATVIEGNILYNPRIGATLTHAAGMFIRPQARMTTLTIRDNAVVDEQHTSVTDHAVVLDGSRAGAIESWTYVAGVSRGLRSTELAETGGTVLPGRR